MSSILVGVVDYGVGNHASIRNALLGAGYRARVSADKSVLDSCDLLLLPGVGSFPAAMSELINRGLDDYLVGAASSGHPIIGICLGMQLLANESLEINLTPGLGIISGKVVPLPGFTHHIGWNKIDSNYRLSLGFDVPDDYFYFNHSYIFQPSEEVQVAKVLEPQCINAAVRVGRVGGVQFHPEKSQGAGIKLLSSFIQELIYA